jgi:serine beta-lactamase-like protein LACTB
MNLSSETHLLRARRTVIVVAVLALVCFSNAVAEVRSSRLAPAIADSLEAIVRQASDRQRNVGLQLVVANRREVLFSMTLGHARLDPAREVDESTRFQVASVTKAFTGAGLLRLVEQGRFDLDLPIQNYVPAFPVKPQGRITPRLLAAHLAGVRSYRPNERDSAFYARHYDNARSTIAIFAADSLVSKPGQRYGYTSYSYNLLAAAMEGATGQDFDTLLRALVLEPLGLGAIRPDDARTEFPERAWSYTVADSVAAPRLAPRNDYTYNPGGGNLLMTANELARFGQALLAPGFLRAESLAQLGNPPASVDSAVTNAGNFGLFRFRDADGRPMVYTTGSIEAYQAGILIYPEHDLVIAVTSNSWGVGARTADLVRGMPQRLGARILGGQGP